MKLITEHNEDLKYLAEDVDGERKMMIEGIFMQAEKQNRNGRVYPRDILEKAVDKYESAQVLKGRAVGELGHPDSPTVNLDRVSHRITELHWDGDNVIGRAQVLETPMGKIVRGLMEGDVQLGVSTRGMGSLEERQGKTYVKDDFMLSTVDIVQDPSCADAMVDGILEGVEWDIDEEGNFFKKEAYKNAIKKSYRNSIDEEERAAIQIREFKNLFFR